MKLNYYCSENHIYRFDEIKKNSKEIGDILNNEKIKKLNLDGFKFLPYSEKSQHLIGEKYEEVTDIAYQTSELLHGFAGAEYVKEKLKITDEEILDAIRYHTIGKKNMGLVSKIVYIADAIEDKRNWPGVEHARELAAEDLDEAIIYEIDMKMKYLITRRALIHPNTLELRNDLIHKDMNEKI